MGIGVVLVSLSFGLSWGTWGGPTRTFATALMGGYALVALLPVSLETIGLVGRFFLVANILVVMGGFALGRTRLGKGRYVLAFGVLSFAAVILLMRGVAGSDAIPVVQTTRWGGLMLNLMVAAVGIVASFPLGVVLALGRRSDLPVVRVFCTLFIELVRGVPLITILFMGSLILPLFLPEEVRIDCVIRAMIGITLFSAAYMAENVRGGLQAIPEGQYDAAKAIGLNGPLTTILIVLPQALRLVIPAIVGQFPFQRYNIAEHCRHQRNPGHRQVHRSGQSRVGYGAHGGIRLYRPAFLGVLLCHVIQQSPSGASVRCWRTINYVQAGARISYSIKQSFIYF